MAVEVQFTRIEPDAAHLEQALQMLVTAYQVVERCAILTRETTRTIAGSPDGHPNPSREWRTTQCRKALYVGRYCDDACAFPALFHEPPAWRST
jgi:hypothetical protein